MAEPITISKLDPPLASMNYAQLRELGLTHIQKLSGKIWSDNNAHDPGITMLEVLAYAITDLGYRTNYDIRDILAPAVPGTDIHNFFTAAQILPNCPVTFNDYRKLLMDVVVEETIGADTIRYGVKNAWLTKANDNEIPFFVDHGAKSLSFEKLLPVSPRVIPNVLYDVLLELDENETYGDLNSNVLSKTISVQSGMFVGMRIQIDVEFPRWDTVGVDWNDVTSMFPHVNKVLLNFSRVPDAFQVQSNGINSAGQVWLNIQRNDNAALSPPEIGAINALELLINETIYDAAGSYQNGLAAFYLRKVAAVNRVLDAARASLHANRNLCEDFFRFKALKVEEIAICAEVDLNTNADVETVLADIQHQIDLFLSPTIYFRSLSEMVERGYTTDQIFEGPLLKHGFVDEVDLEKSQTRKTLHVSDLISIIMDIPGVEAVRSIQVANIPLDNDDAIPTKEVRWCLNLSFDKGYIPRLGINRSRFTFFKEQLPFIADALETQEKLDALEALDRPQKLFGTPLDYAIPEGEYKNLGEYYSLQNDFPLLYGIGDAGLPSTASLERKNQARQLKAFLLFFEQILANYLAQLEHVKDLFSLDGSRQVNGQFTIDKTYFSQALIHLVPNATELYQSAGSPVLDAFHASNLQNITEDQAGFEARRNRILDHLAARFGESFTDYALLIYNIDGKKAPDELIEDKLALLNNYPLISSARGKGFNYLDPAKLWHIDNISGVERRVRALTGIDPIQIATLTFSPRLAIEPSGLQFSINVYNVPFATIPPFVSLDLVLNSTSLYNTTDEAKLALELLIVNGVQPRQYVMAQNIASVWTPIDPFLTYPVSALVLPAIVADGRVIAISTGTPTAYASRSNAEAALTAFRTIAIPLFEHDYQSIIASNRANLACDFSHVMTDDELVSDAQLGPCPSNQTQWYYKVDILSPDGSVDICTYERMLADPGETMNDHFVRANVSKRMETLGWATRPENYDLILNPVIDSPIASVVSSIPSIVLKDRCGDIRGKFTTVLVSEFLDTYLNTVATVKVVDSTYNTGTKTRVQALYDVADPKNILINIVEAVDTQLVDGKVLFTIPATMSAVDMMNNSIDVNEDFIDYADEDFVISIDTGGFAPLNFTVVSVKSLGGGMSRVFVEEPLPVGTYIGNTATLFMELPIIEYRINTLSLTQGFLVKFTPFERFVARTTGWFFDTYFNREGFHVVEHILLRPKSTVTELYPISQFALNPTTPGGSNGELVFSRNITILEVNNLNKTFKIQGVFTDELIQRTDIRVVGTFGNDGFYTVRSATDDGINTTITVYEQFYAADDTPGTIQYWKRYAISNLNAGTNSVTIVDAIHPASGFAAITNEVIIEGADPKTNNGRYALVADPTVSGSQYTFALGFKRVPLREEFLPIDLEADCKSCVITDPYSFVATVVLPAWAGRFSNQNFRRFFERTVRLEMPAHILVNICWVTCESMLDFERKWRRWLVENTQGANRPAYTQAHRELLESIDRLRSVYASGTLHDCDTDDEMQHSIILNNSVLGTL